MKVVVTGASGFLGWHTRARLRALTHHDVVSASRANWAQLPDLISGADAIIHIAGVNRAAPDEVRHGNIALAQDVAVAVRCTGARPRIIFANSRQAGNDSAYGEGKSSAARLLRQVAATTGAPFSNVLLPNLFGEHGRPHYNSFVATFVDAVIRGEEPSIENRLVPILHVQRAAAALINRLASTESADIRPAGQEHSVQEVYNKLKSFFELYRQADIPPLVSKFDVDLFNTLRAALFPAHYPIALTEHTDDRGRLVETVRSHGGQGQTFVSTTRPGVTRGDHFHLTKIERFVVLAGEARISLRKVLTDEVISFDVTGDKPAVVDMPTMWVHKIANLGSRDLVTFFWTHELHDPKRPDTFWEKVSQEGGF